MPVSNQLAAKITSVSNFRNLALFVCHLVIGGQFRTGHILFDPHIFDTEFGTEIRSKCPNSIVWLMTDVTKPFSPPWQPNENTDRVLQLILMDQEHFPTDFEKLTEMFTLYRIFVFWSKEEMILNDKLINTMVKSTHPQYSTSIVLKFNLEHGTMALYNIQMNSEMCENSEKTQNNENIEIGEKLENSCWSVDVKPIHLSEELQKSKNLNLNSEGIFSLTFNDYENNWLLEIERKVPRPIERPDLEKLFELWNGLSFVSNFFVSSFSSSYINHSTVTYSENGTQLTSKLIQHQNRKYYQELTTKYSQIDDSTLYDLSSIFCSNSTQMCESLLIVVSFSGNKSKSFDQTHFVWM